MTEPQMEIFRKVLDTNWEAKELIEAGKWRDAQAKIAEKNKHIEDLKALMGEEEYNNFIRMGQKMFAPVGEEDEE